MKISGGMEHEKKNILRGRLRTRKDYRPHLSKIAVRIFTQLVFHHSKLMERKILS
jgi:hypothetical protein